MILTHRAYFAKEIFHFQLHALCKARRVDVDPASYDLALLCRVGPWDPQDLKVCVCAAFLLQPVKLLSERFPEQGCFVFHLPTRDCFVKSKDVAWKRQT